MRLGTLTALFALLAAAGFLFAEDRAALKKKNILKDGAVADAWVYDDLPKALKAARKESKPIFLVFR